MKQELPKYEKQEKWHGTWERHFFNLINNGARGNSSDDDDLELADEEDRTTEHNLVGCHLKVFYDDQADWFTGKIMWFNKKLNKRRIYFKEDDSGDYIYENNINGTDMILLTWGF